MGTADDGVRIRPREDADLPACVEVARVVHDLDGYPPFLPGGAFDRFLISREAINAWVAEDSSGILGHVALHRSSSQPVMEAATASLGLPEDRLGVVARLLVAPQARRVGLGRQMLSTATDEAHGLELAPILDVGVRFTRAVALYESCGWERLAQVEVRLPDGTILHEYVYAGPAGAPPDGEVSG
ncbi:MAG: GNAT family N-acetyltransferase [Acidimicrobiales bacterium]